MSRTAQEVLEFDKLRELLRLRTTCAPGRRAVNALEPGMERAVLEATFALIREAREWLRAARELGFGALADLTLLFHSHHAERLCAAFDRPTASSTIRYISPSRRLSATRKLCGARPAITRHALRSEDFASRLTGQNDRASAIRNTVKPSIIARA